MFYQEEEKGGESLSRHKSYAKEVFLVCLQGSQQPGRRRPLLRPHREALPQSQYSSAVGQ